MQHEEHALAVARHLSRLALSLSAEPDHRHILEEVVDSAMELLHCDAGTLYIFRDDKLHFSVLRTQSLGIRDNAPSLDPITLFKPNGEPSDLVVAHAFVDRTTINIPDLSQETRFDFSGTFAFDRQFGYNSRSFLCVPLMDHEQQVIGVLQLINAIDDQENVCAFNQEQQLLLEALGSLAATVLTQRQLIDTQRALFESFIRVIAEGIDYKSPVTGRHCQQVPEIAMMLAEGVNQAGNGTYANTRFSAEEMYELKIAAWLHDCGKITTPEAIIDKGTKLETQFDRIELVASRIREYQQSLLIDCLTHSPDDSEALDSCRSRIAEMDLEMEFLRTTNRGSEFTSPEAVARIEQLATISWTGLDGRQRTLLSENEVRNLSISRGTLLPEELQLMRDHIRVTDRMLNSLVYPKSLSHVPEIAVNHHEHLDGTGYPRGLSADGLSVRARIMCIADIFEALTSPDRPYKEGMKLSQALTIIGRKVEDNQIDGELFTIFVRQGIYKRYAELFMAESQIDEPDLDKLPGLMH
ncbi:ABC-type amino acid transport protein [Marinobacterium lacunae]|uniref:ABC-type amino acid transport protein n=1 Tax=Marinobacterium lacunae TaxID=1232683 RepID=A0A081FUH6_9GAMM|nr:HD domain-containing phosphohydrolase [Marinobacterium lacunae]KEA62181.1 ABC-type amino acid transport protein [Marinobacterium lacunae]MBR9884082.1 GAF domain-containing protein [Oceanospirillales bacterium]